MDGSLWMQSESLPQVKELKYLTGAGKVDREIGRRVDASSTGSDAGVVPEPCGKEGAEPGGEALDEPVHLRSNPRNGRELWVVTERTTSQMSFGDDLGPQVAAPSFSSNHSVNLQQDASEKVHI